MAKALELSPETMSAPPVPKAAQIPIPELPAVPQSKQRKIAKIEHREPLQVRWPSDDVKAAKLASIQLDFPTVSDFMLACFHAYMKTHKPS
jgi:hypothetical protein